MNTVKSSLVQDNLNFGDLRCFLYQKVSSYCLFIDHYVDIVNPMLSVGLIPKTWMEVHAYVYNSNGKIIYDRKIETKKIVIPNKFSQSEYNTYFENSVQNAIQTFWTDIFGG